MLKEENNILEKYAINKNNKKYFSENFKLFFLGKIKKNFVEVFEFFFSFVIYILNNMKEVVRYTKISILYL